MHPRRGGAGPRSVRQWNEFAVVESLRAQGRQRISELASATGLTPAPLGQVMQSLAAKGWVRATRQSSVGRGRPAQAFELHPPPGWVLGLDVGDHATRVVRLGLDGEVAAQSEVRSPDGTRDADRLATVEHVLSQVLEGIDPESVWLTELAVSGRVNPGGAIVQSVAIPEWEGHNPAELFSPLLGTRPGVVNDVHAATYAEHAVGSAQGFDDVMLAYLGRRPTLGLLFGGQPRSGAHGVAGDLSRQQIIPTEESMEWLNAFHGDRLGEAIGAALTGDEAVMAAVRGFVNSIAPALAFATSVVDPGVLVISGALAPLADHFLADLREYLDGQLRETPVVLASALDQYSAALGAGLIGIRTVLDTLASPSHGVAEFSRTEFRRLAHVIPA